MITFSLFHQKPEIHLSAELKANSFNSAINIVFKFIAVLLAPIESKSLAKKPTELVGGRGGEGSDVELGRGPIPNIPNNVNLPKYITC